ncbi:MAG: type II toxin-antitoxin system prevent-host-death family antitoxin [Methylophaga sp.]|nr:type II toxin-antitoxin system prevent-host-death family antitoxin [Methylophaga sp.]
MKALSANEAKTQFGNLLLNAQREPVQINKNGKPVAVMMSIEDYKYIERLKLSLLQDRATRAKQDRNSIDGEAFFKELIAGKHD